MPGMIPAGCRVGYGAQMASALGEAGSLMALRCQPAEPLPPVALPRHLRLWGVDSGIRHRYSSCRRSQAWLAFHAVHRLSSKAIPLARLMHVTCEARQLEICCAEGSGFR